MGQILMTTSIGWVKIATETPQKTNSVFQSKIPPKNSFSSKKLNVVVVNLNACLCIANASIKDWCAIVNVNATNAETTVNLNKKDKKPDK